MLILALDTTTRAGSTAVLRDDVLLALVPGEAQRTHAERLPAEIERALAIAGVPRHGLDLLAVAAGPGAFTGLRIGIAIVQGLAMTLDRPVVGVSALEALALAAIADGRVPPRSLVASWMDASRGEVFGALYRHLADTDWPRSSTALPFEALVAATADTPTNLIAAWQPIVGEQPTAFTGDGAQRYAALVAQSVTALATCVIAPAVGRIARRLAAQGLATAPHALQPVYVRRPDVEIERDRVRP